MTDALNSLKYSSKIIKGRIFTVSMPRTIIPEEEKSSSAAKSTAEASEESSLLRTTNSGLTYQLTENIEKHKALKKSLDPKQLMELLIEDFNDFSKDKNSINRQNQLLISLGIIISPENRKLLVDRATESIKNKKENCSLYIIIN